MGHIRRPLKFDREGSAMQETDFEVVKLNILEVKEFVALIGVPGPTGPNGQLSSMGLSLCNRVTNNQPGFAQITMQVPTPVPGETGDDARVFMEMNHTIDNANFHALRFVLTGSGAKIQYLHNGQVKKEIAFP
jgi:hypothetical protein